MNLTCPCCYATSPLEAYAMTDAQRELLHALAKLPPELFRPMLAYIGLFRPPTRPLTPVRALYLVNEVMELGADPRVLLVALTDTVEALRSKRAAGNGKPMTKHNYLKEVLKSTTYTPPSGFLTQNEAPAPGKRRQALNLLAAWGEGSLLRAAIAAGLSGLVAIGRPGTPAAEMICANADIWLHLLVKHSCCDTELDAGRVTRAFSALVQKPMKEWPEPAALLPHLPARPYQPALPVIVTDTFDPATAEKIAAFREGL